MPYPVRKGSALHLVAFPHQDFDAGFGFFQLLAAGLAQLHSLLEKLQRALQRQVAALHFFDDGLQFLQAGFEAGDRFFFGGHLPYCSVACCGTTWANQCVKLSGAGLGMVRHSRFGE